MNTIQLTEAVDPIAAKNYRKTEVFKSLGIDFLCNGDKILNEISEETGITAGKLMAAFERVTMGKSTSFREFNNWDLDSLIDYIINTHHQYAKTSAVIIHDLAQEVANHHKEKHPELIKLTTAIFLFFHDLLNHLKIEEQILFPNIKELIKNKSCQEIGIYTTFGLIKESIRRMQKAHQAMSKDLKLFNELTNNYKLPEGSCSSYKYLFEKMKEFEADFLLHVYLENNILFPKALAEDEEFNDSMVINTERKK
jgi:regulator of cell morphogenesis and NO signaling